MSVLPLNYYEGETCGRNDCIGIIASRPTKNCSCHLGAPCSSCTAPANYCKTCGWEESDEEVINDYVVQVDRSTGDYKSWSLRELDSCKIDWHSHHHTNSSMIKRGVYPPGTSQKDVLAEVNGTFGGRFNYFGNGKFEFVAYTD